MATGHCHVACFILFFLVSAVKDAARYQYKRKVIINNYNKTPIRYPLSGAACSWLRKIQSTSILKADYFESLTSNGVPRPHPELCSDAVFIIIVKINAAFNRDIIDHIFFNALIWSIFTSKVLYSLTGDTSSSDESLKFMWPFKTLVLLFQIVSLYSLIFGEQFGKHGCPFTPQNLTADTVEKKYQLYLQKWFFKLMIFDTVLV